MTIAAYQTLYQSSVTFAMRKQLQAEHGKADLEKTIEQLESKKTKLENKVQELKSKIEAIEKRNKERKEVEIKKREQEVEFLKYQEAHLSKFLKQVAEKAKP
jgi:dynein light intermediate chain